MKRVFLFALVMMNLGFAQFHPFITSDVALDVVDSNAAVLIQTGVGAELALASSHSISLRILLGMSPYFLEGTLWETKMGIDALYRYHLDKQRTLYGGAGWRGRIMFYGNSDADLPMGWALMAGYEYQFEPQNPFSIFVEAGLDFHRSGRFNLSDTAPKGHTAVNPSITVGAKWHLGGSDR